MAIITLTAEDDGTSVEALPGDEIVVLLPENATTGYRWHVDRPQGCIVVESDGYQTVSPTEGGEAVFGRGGTREFRFRVTGPGTSVLALKLWREWEGERSVTQRFTVTVRASEK